MLQKFFIICSGLWILDDISNWNKREINRKRIIFKGISCVIIFVYSFLFAALALKYSRDNLSTFYSTCLSVALMLILKKNIEKLKENKLYFKKLKKDKEILFELIEEKNFNNLSVVCILSFRIIKFSILRIMGYDGLCIVNVASSVVAIIFIVLEALINFDIIFASSIVLAIMREIILTLIIFIFLSTLLSWMGKKLSSSIGIFFKFFRYFRNGLISKLFNK